MLYNTVSKHSIFYGLIHSFLYLCINKNICLMEVKFVYVVMFGAEYICHVTGIENAIILAKQLKKSLKEQGKVGFYDIYFHGVVIAKF